MTNENKCPDIDKCISCNKAVVLLARFSDGHRCRFCNDHVRTVGYVRRKHDEI